MKDIIIKAMNEAGRPLSAGELHKMLGVEKKKIDQAMAELKKEEIIISHVRCKWEPK